MKYVDVRAEVEYYVRKIKVLEDWFKFVITKGYLQEGDGMRLRLNEKRPEVPRIHELIAWDKTMMLREAGPLSLHAEHLDAIRHECFKRNLVHSHLRMGIATVMTKLEAGELSNWTSPFTIGMNHLDHVFGSKLKFLHER